MKQALIFFVFVIATIAGTLSHEAGHYLAYVFYNIPAHISYASTTGNVAALQQMKEAAIENGAMDRFNSMVQTIIFAGPLVTLFISFTGFIWLLYLSARTSIDVYKLAHLMPVVLSLFCSRAVFNSLSVLIRYYELGHANIRNDEYRLFEYWNVPQWAGQGVLLISCAALCIIVCFKLVQKHRWPLICFGVAGCLAGYILWMHLLGPVFIP